MCNRKYERKKRKAK
jgi:hypothetical protein